MFRNETSEQKSLITFLIAFVILISFSQVSMASNNSGSNNNNSNNGQTVNCARVANDDVAYFQRNGGTFKNQEEKSKYYQKALNRCYAGGNPQGCEKDMKDLSDAKAKFLSACGKARMPSTGTAGNIGCSEAIRKCEQSNEVAASIDGDANYDVEAESEKLNYCPAKAGENLKEIKEELKAAKEELNELEDSIPELTEKVTQAKTEGETQMLEMQEQMQEQQRQCRDQQIQMEDSLSDEEKRLHEEAQQMYAQIIQLNEQIAKADQGMVEAQIRYNQVVYEEEQKCHAAAINKVNERRKEIISRVATSTYNVGSFSAAVSRAGKTSRQLDQELAETEFRFCISDASYKRTLTRAAQNRDAEQRASEVQKASLSQQLTQLQQQMGIKQNNDIQSARTRTQRNVANLINDCAQMQTTMSQKMGQAQMSAHQNMISAQGQLAQKQKRLQEAQNSYKNLRDINRVKIRAGGDEKATEGFYEALASFAEYEGRAQTFRQSCCGDLEETRGTCVEISNFMGVSNTYVADVSAPAAPERPVEAGAAQAASAASPTPTPRPNPTPRRNQASENIPIPEPRPVRKGPLPHPGQTSTPQQQSR